MPNETIEKEASTLKETLLKEINNLDFSFKPENGTIVNGNDGKAIPKAVKQFEESCEKLKEAVKHYKDEEEKKSAKSNNKFKIKSALGMKLSLGKIDEFLKSMNDNSKFKNDFGNSSVSDVVFSCSFLMDKIAKLRKSIKPTSPTNVKIRSKLSSFEKQLNGNLKIWMKDPEREKVIKKK